MTRKHITYTLTFTAIIIALTVFGLDNKAVRKSNDNFETVGHNIDTVGENLTAHKFSIYTKTSTIDEIIEISRELESTKGRISNSILFFDNRQSALTYSKTWRMTKDILPGLRASYFSNNKFHKETFCYGNDSLTVNNHGTITGWTNCKTVSELSKSKKLK